MRKLTLISALSLLAIHFSACGEDDPEEGCDAGFIENDQGECVKEGCAAGLVEDEHGECVTQTCDDGFALNDAGECEACKPGDECADAIPPIVVTGPCSDREYALNDHSDSPATGDIFDRECCTWVRKPLTIRSPEDWPETDKNCLVSMREIMVHGVELPNYHIVRAGQLMIYDYPESNLEKLTYLHEVKTLVIQDSEALLSLRGLENLESIRTQLVINNNENLPNLNGLKNLEEVGKLTIVGNAKLRDLSHLDSLTTATEANVNDNPQLCQSTAEEFVDRVAGEQGSAQRNGLSPDATCD